MYFVWWRCVPCLILFSAFLLLPGCVCYTNAWNGPVHPLRIMMKTCDMFLLWYDSYPWCCCIITSNECLGSEPDRLACLYKRNCQYLEVTFSTYLFSLLIFFIFTCKKTSSFVIIRFLKTLRITVFLSKYVTSCIPQWVFHANDLSFLCPLTMCIHGCGLSTRFLQMKRLSWN